MNIALLVAGVVVLVAGLLAMGLGILEKEFEVGKTLILSGTVAACTGFIVLGLVLAIGQLREIARRLGPAQAGSVPARRPRAEPPPQAFPGPVADASADAPPLDLEPPAGEPSVDAEVPPLAAPPWQDEARGRPRGNGPPPLAAPPLPPAATEPAAEAKPRRNLLFSSSSRKERERATARSSEPVAPDQHSGPPPAAPPPPLPQEAAPRTFEDAWPAPEAGRSDSYRRGGRTPPTLGDASPVPAQPAGQAAPAVAEERTQVTVLKSGVVDGMAYSLYSDGSIEAQMPEGMMRFASIAELREHLEQRP